MAFSFTNLSMFKTTTAQRKLFHVLDYFVYYQMHCSTEFVFVDRWRLRNVQCVRLLVLPEAIVALPFWVFRCSILSSLRDNFKRKTLRF